MKNTITPAVNELWQDRNGLIKALVVTAPTPSGLAFLWLSSNGTLSTVEDAKQEHFCVRVAKADPANLLKVYTG